MEVMEVGFDIDKIRFDVYKSHCLALRMKLSLLQKSFDEIRKQIEIKESRLAYYDTQMIKYIEQGYDWHDQIREIEAIPSRSRA